MIYSISPQELQQIMSSGQRIILLDVRTSEECQLGIIEQAQLFPLQQLLSSTEFSFSPQNLIICYCASGKRSVTAATYLKKLGFDHVSSLAGGIHAWNETFPEINKSPFSAEEQQRYHRQMLLPEVGLAGQIQLSKSKVLLVGLGGLGSPAALYLAAAGVGTLGLLDRDCVELSNLQRQILHNTHQLGRTKVESAALSLKALNSNCHLNLHHEELRADNAQQLLSPYDIILDCSDNLPTRYLLNDFCWQLGKPLVHGSVYRFEGHVTVFQRGKSACYRCIYPEPPAEKTIPSCQEAGVLGVIPGVIGLLQATETMKFILKQGTSLLNRLLIFNAHNMHFSELQLQARPACHCQKEDWKPDFNTYQQSCCQNVFPSL